MSRAARVREHLRKGLPVRRHLRRLSDWARGVPPPFTVRLFREGANERDIKTAADLRAQGLSPRTTRATVDLFGNPREIILVNPTDVDTEDLARILSHETLHSVLFTENDRDRYSSGFRPQDTATLALDRRRARAVKPGAKHELTRGGLYQYQKGPQTEPFDPETP